MRSLQPFKNLTGVMPKIGAHSRHEDRLKWALETGPIGCTRSPFSLPHMRFDTWVWTFGTIYMQSTQGERFI